MQQTTTFNDRVRGALYGMFIGDALAMPVHWYYDTQALVRDYGVVTDYLKPRNPHPDSILWRSSYSPPSGAADILHDQAQYWGIKGIHYHQFLQAGENTLNVKLARELLFLLQQDGAYSPESWLERMVVFLTTPGNHQDTYLEEYLRHFFTTLAQKKNLLECGRKDENHIGGFSLMVPLTIALADEPHHAKALSLQHLGLTHGGPSMQLWGKFLVSALINALSGLTLKKSLAAAAEEAEHSVDLELYENLADYPDIAVVTRHFSSACYVDYAVPATIYLALRYEQSPQEGLTANIMCGGDNAGRGALLGALLGAVNGMEAWPAKWVDGLLHPPPDIHLASPQP